MVRYVPARPEDLPQRRVYVQHVGLVISVCAGGDRINGTQHYLWRTVDQHGNVLDILVQPRRNALAAKKFFRRLLKGLR